VKLRDHKVHGDVDWNGANQPPAILIDVKAAEDVLRHIQSPPDLSPGLARIDEP